MSSIMSTVLKKRHFQVKENKYENIEQHRGVFFNCPLRSEMWVLDMCQNDRNPSLKRGQLASYMLLIENLCDTSMHSFLFVYTFILSDHSLYI